MRRKDCLDRTAWYDHNNLFIKFALYVINTLNLIAKCFHKRQNDQANSFKAFSKVDPLPCGPLNSTLVPPNLIA